MAVRRDEVQLDISFITDESKSLANTLQTTKQYNNALAESAAKIKVYQKELEKVGADEAKRAPVLAKINIEQQKQGVLLAKVAAEAKKVADIDLTKLTPAQLIERAKQLEQVMRSIPTSHPAYKELAEQLLGINNRLATIRAETKGVSQGLNDAAGKASLFQRALSVAGGLGLFSLIQQGLSSLVNFGKESLKAIDSQLKADAQIKAAIASTAGAAGKSLEDLQAQANELQKVTLFSDDQTEQAQALLLTFRNIRGEVFDQTIPLLQDLSTALGQDLKSSSIQVGKALNDPVNGIKALQRVGITFSDSQKSMIKSLVETGDVAGAQTVILKELEAEVGGSAKAAAEAGLGPYQVLQNRLGEVQETVGALIERGLKLLAPAFKAGVDFLEVFANSLLSGEKATGKYGTAVNIVIGILTALVKAGQVVFESLRLLYDTIWVPLSNIFFNFIIPGLESVVKGYANIIQAAKGLPIVGDIFRVIGNYIQIFKDLIDSVPATFAGFREAAKQAVANVLEYFIGLARSAAIVAKEIELALTVRSEARKALQDEIAALKAQEVAAKAAGRSVGEAYAQGRDKAIQEANAKAAAEEKAEQGRQAAIKKKEAQEAATVADKKIAEQRKKALELRLSEIEASFLKEEIVTDRALFKKEISESEHDKRILLLKQKQYEEQIKAFQTFHQEETKEALEAQRKLLEIQQNLTPRAGVPSLAPLPTSAPGQVTSQTAGIDKKAAVTSSDDEIKILQDKLARVVDLEQNNELLRLEMLRTFLNEKLAILRENDLTETGDYKETLDAKLKADEDYQAKKVENEERTAELSDKIMQASLQVSSDFFGAMADLLASDEKARKKNAGAIKAFQTAQVIVDGIQEVQKIWSTVMEFGPVAGPILGAVLTAVAVGRTVLAISKINSAKFERGKLVDFEPGVPKMERGDMIQPGPSAPPAPGRNQGPVQVFLQRLYEESGSAGVPGMLRAKFGFFGGKPHSAGGTKGYFEDGTAIEVERDEAFAVVNKKNAPMLRFLSRVNAHGGHGDPFFHKGGMLRFASGGIPPVNTNPVPSTAQAPEAARAAQFGMELANELKGLREDVAGWNRSLKANVVYQDVEDAGTELDSIRDDAAI